MVLGIGTDILKIERICKGIINKQDAFLKKTYSVKEIEEAFKRETPQQYLATRFAGKEAVFKALAYRSEHVDLSEIEILSHENGQPYVTLHGKLYEFSKSAGIDEVLLSLSYDTDYAIAYAIAQGSMNKK